MSHSIENLVKRARRGCVKSIEEVYAHYRPIVSERARNVAMRNSAVTHHDVESALMVQIMTCFEDYDESQPWTNFVTSSLNRKCAQVVVDAHKSAWSRNVTRSLDEPVGEDGSVTLTLGAITPDTTVDVEAYVVTKLAIAAYRDKLGHDTTLERVFLRLMRGDTYTEIARDLAPDAHRKHDHTLKAWTMRHVEKIREILDREAIS